jgi:gustatory receptor
MNTIYTVKPSIRIFQAVGIAPVAIDRSLKVVTSSSFQVYSSFLLVIFSIAFIFGLFNSKLQMNAENNGIGNTVDYIQLVGIRICHILILMESLLQHTNVTLFFEKLCEFDFLVQRKLNILKDHRQDRRRISLQLATLLCFYIFCEIIFVVIVILRKDYEFFEYWAIYLLPFVVCCLKYTQTVGFVQLIKTRYRFLNEKLATLKWSSTSVHQDSSIIRNDKVVNAIEYRMERELQQLKVNKLANQKKLQITSIDEMIVIRNLFDKMCDLSGLINQIFGLSMLINIGNDFVAITSNSYFIFAYFQDTTIQNKDSWKILGGVPIKYFVHILTIKDLTLSFGIQIIL